MNDFRYLNALTLFDNIREIVEDINNLYILTDELSDNHNRASDLYIKRFIKRLHDGDYANYDISNCYNEYKKICEPIIQSLIKQLDKKSDEELSKTKLFKRSKQIQDILFHIISRDIIDKEYNNLNTDVKNRLYNILLHNMITFNSSQNSSAHHGICLAKSLCIFTKLLNKYSNKTITSYEELQSTYLEILNEKLKKINKNYRFKSYSKTLYYDFSKKQHLHNYDDDDDYDYEYNDDDEKNEFDISDFKPLIFNNLNMKDDIKTEIIYSIYTNIIYCGHIDLNESKIEYHRVNEYFNRLFDSIELEYNDELKDQVKNIYTYIKQNRTKHWYDDSDDEDDEDNEDNIDIEYDKTICVWEFFNDIYKDKNFRFSLIEGYLVDGYDTTNYKQVTTFSNIIKQFVNINITENGFTIINIYNMIKVLYLIDKRKFKYIYNLFISNLLLNYIYKNNEMLPFMILIYFNESNTSHAMCGFYKNNTLKVYDPNCGFTDEYNNLNFYILFSDKKAKFNIKRLTGGNYEKIFRYIIYLLILVALIVLIVLIIKNKDKLFSYGDRNVNTNIIINK